MQNDRGRNAGRTMDIPIENSLYLDRKLKHLKERLRELGRAAVAFSGGVDSTFLLKAAHEVLGENVIAITAVSDAFPVRETTEASSFCQAEGIRHILFPFQPLRIEGFSRNPADRCYLCKHALFESFLRIAEEEGGFVLIEGSNMDDTGDYRPGLRALAEHRILSPLKECGLYKAEIRSLSEQYHLPTWDKPSYACLASRFPYGEEITKEKLRMVEQGEDLLMKLGFTQMRVRIHGTVARIELLPEDFGKILQEETRTLIYRRFSEFGFSYTSLDLKGYRTGSMNERIPEKNGPGINRNGEIQREG